MIDRRIDLKGIASESINSDDFVNNIMKIFSKDENRFDIFLFEYFKKNIENSLGEINDNPSIDKIIPKKNREIFLRTLEEKTDIVMPRPVMSWFSFFLSILLVLIPVVIIIYISLINAEFFLFTLMILSIGGFSLLFVLVAIVWYFRPDLLSSNDLPKVKTFSDFINEVVKINKHFYKINDFRLTKELLALQYKVIQYEKLS